MKRVVALLLLVSCLCVQAAETGITNLVVVTPLDVDPKSVTLTGADTCCPNVNFNYLNKTPEQIRAIDRKHSAVLVMKDGVVVAKAVLGVNFGGRHAPDGHPTFTGLTLLFDDIDQARIAEKVLKREDKRPH